MLTSALFSFIANKIVWTKYSRSEINITFLSIDEFFASDWLFMPTQSLQLIKKSCECGCCMIESPISHEKRKKGTNHVSMSLTYVIFVDLERSHYMFHVDDCLFQCLYLTKYLKQVLNLYTYRFFATYPRDYFSNR